MSKKPSLSLIEGKEALDLGVFTRLVRQPDR
jgi:hypothetical protein